MLGHSKTDLQSMHRDDLLLDGESAAMQRIIEERARTGHARGEVWLRRGDGKPTRMELSTALYTDNTGQQRANVILRDVTERTESLRSISLAASALANIADGVAVVDRRWRIISVNRSFTRITGSKEHEIIGRRPRIEFSNRQRYSFRSIRREIHRRGYWQGKALKRQANGEALPVLVSISLVRDERNRVTNFVLVFNDISERMEYERQLEILAHYDPVTTLPNRLLLEERARRTIIRAGRHKYPMAVLFVDLDHFKTVNDSLGHTAGDRLLQLVGDRLRGAVREIDTVARVGGDEFVILLNELANASDAAIVGGKMLEAFRQPFTLTDRRVYTGISIGAACYPQDGEDFPILLRNADMAMYRAKAQGRANFQFYSADMNSGAEHALILQSSLHQALEKEEFEVYYQPFVDLASGSVTGMEALIRWKNPELGLVSPEEFIPLAEESGLIVPIGEWVLRESCAALRRLHSAGHGHLRVAVNLSARQFGLANLADRVGAILKETGLDGRFLELEITETVAMNRLQDAFESMAALRAMGITIALDDFGTGYSSLKYLNELSINYLKVDRSFVRGIPENAGSTSITHAVIAMAHNLEIEVIAEGIETPAQLSALRDWGCNEGQGYLLSVPLAEADLRWLLDAHPRLPVGATHNGIDLQSTNGDSR